MLLLPFTTFDCADWWNKVWNGMVAACQQCTETSPLIWAEDREGKVWFSERKCGVFFVHFLKGSWLREWLSYHSKNCHKWREENLGFTGLVPILPDEGKDSLHYSPLLTPRLTYVPNRLVFITSSLSKAKLVKIATIRGWVQSLPSDRQERWDNRLQIL